MSDKIVDAIPIYEDKDGDKYTMVGKMKYYSGYWFGIKGFKELHVSTRTGLGYSPENNWGRGKDE